MNFIDEAQVLDYYVDLLHQKKIHFFEIKPHLKAQFLDQITGLKDQQDLHQRIEAAKRIWKILFEASLTAIHPDKGGYDSLFSYFDTYVAFEELIFASDAYYRDHTLHCLWVYFLGEYLYHHPSYNHVFQESTSFMAILKNLVDLFEANNIKDSAYIGVKKMLHSVPDLSIVRCLTALTHDLGYPLKKIRKINKSIQQVLPYFGIDHYTEFDFQYGNTHMPFLNELLQIMSININFNPIKKKDQEVINQTLQKYFLFDHVGSGTALNPDIQKMSSEEIYQDWHNVEWQLTYFQDNAYKLRYTQDFEKYEHGMMSAYLLFKHLNVFKNLNISPNGKGGISIKVGQEHIFNTLYIVFQGIADHTSDGYKITNLSDSSAMLAFIDELEEFSRISRADQNRQFIDEFCKTAFENSKGCFTVSFVFDNHNLENLNPEMAFRGRCRRLLKLFDIPNLDPQLQICIQCIGQLPHNQNTYSITLRRGFAQILINDIEQNIPAYLKSSEFYTTEEYAAL